MQKTVYNKKMKEQIQNDEQREMCFLCGEDHPKLLEKHHWKGRANSDDIINLCLNCHFKVTHSQNKLAPHNRSKNADQQIKWIYMLRTQASLQKEMGESQLKITEMMLNEQDSSKSICKTNK